MRRKHIDRSIDIRGMKFGKLTALLRIEGKYNKDGCAIWQCICDCGQSARRCGKDLRIGRVKSCGCLLAEHNHKGNANRKHGRCKTAEYNSWANAKARCSNNDDLDYGGRGIKVCERWLASFENFFQDMGIKPSSKHSLDRIDVNGNYEPSNCKWSDAKEQTNNRRIKKIENFSDDEIISEFVRRKLSVPSDPI